MDRPTVDEVLGGLSSSRDADTEEPNRYTAVMVTAKRARQINTYYHGLGDGGALDTFVPPPVANFSKNYLSIAMAEVSRGEIAYRLRSTRR
jgi:DNA-directed RNA polymerase subunit omega